MSQILILAVGQDSLVLSTRCSILQTAGYIVRSTSSVAESIDLFEDDDFDLLLLCHSIPLQDRDELIRLVRSTGSRIPIYIVESSTRDFQAGLADGVLSNRPDRLVTQLGDLVERARPTAHAGCH